MSSDRLLGDEEIKRELDYILWNHHLVPSPDDIHDVWKDNPTNITDTATAKKRLFELFDTQKRLYAESESLGVRIDELSRHISKRKHWKEGVEYEELIKGWNGHINELEKRIAALRNLTVEK